jgi:riboflavin synthase
MFSGIVTAVGTVRTVEAGADGLSMVIAAPFGDLALGESVAVDGACLTVGEMGPGWFGVRAVDTTLERTRFRAYQVGQRVNLERALQVGDRLGGHLVQGHVDGIGRVRSVTQQVDARVVDLDVPPAVAEAAVPMGSVTVDGVSLTIVAVPAPGLIQISLIPFTLQHTTLDRLAPGVEVHVEADMIAKYVAALVERTKR